MKNPDQVIATLIELALQHYQESGKPDSYATTAAHIVAKASAAEYCRESADAAAFVAALNDISSKVELSKYSAQLADDATKMHNATNRYHAKAGVLAGRKIPAFDEIELSFEDIVNDLDDDSFGTDANDIYNSTFNAHKSDAYRLALIAACNNYPYAYTCARSAYVFSIAIAARYPEGDRRDAVFTTTITKRLTRELKHEPVDPSFFMQIMCSDAMKFIGVALLVAGLLAFSLGICGLAIVSVGAFLLNIGLTSAAVTTTGALMSATGVGIYAGRLFTERQWNHDNEESHKAIDAMNMKN